MIRYQSGIGEIQGVRRNSWDAKSNCRGVVEGSGRGAGVARVEMLDETRDETWDETRAGTQESTG